MEQSVSTPKSLGDVIRRHRKLRKLTQKEAGSPYKLEQSTVSTLEKGASGTRLKTLFRMLSALNLEIVIREKNDL
jgi:HTH-type transcriptional regulator / antitoxin HipB